MAGFERGMQLCLPRVPTGELPYHDSIARFGADAERFVLPAIHQASVAGDFARANPCWPEHC